MHLSHRGRIAVVLWNSCWQISSWPQYSDKWTSSLLQLVLFLFFSHVCIYTSHSLSFSSSSSSVVYLLVLLIFSIRALLGHLSSQSFREINSYIIFDMTTMKKKLSQREWVYILIYLFTIWRIIFNVYKSIYICVHK